MRGEKHGAEGCGRCPYCDGAAERSLPVCQFCGAVVVRCRSCGRLLTQEETECPRCGAQVAAAPDTQS